MKHSEQIEKLAEKLALQAEEIAEMALAAGLAAMIAEVDLCGEITVPLLMHCAPAGLAPVYLPADTISLMRAICGAVDVDPDIYPDDILGNHIRDVLTDDMEVAQYGDHIINDIAANYEILNEDDGTVLDQGEVTHLLWEVVDKFKAEKPALEMG